MPAKDELIKIIKFFKLDFRFTHWREHLFMAEQGAYSDDICDMLLPEARVDAESVEKSGNFLDIPPNQENLGTPDIEIGGIAESDGQRFGIKYLDRPRNCLIISGAGGGKTVCARALCINVDKNNQTQSANPTLLFIIDIKPDYLDLKHKLIGDTVILSVVNNAKIGLNGPENVSPFIWIGQISLSLAGRLGLIKSRTGLAAIIIYLLLAMNPGLKKQDLNNPGVSIHLKWPTLKTILKAAQNPKLSDIFFSKASYTESLIGALEGLLWDSGTIFDCCNGIDMNSIIAQKKHVILNVSTLPSYITHIITDIFINQVLIKRMAENYKTSHTDLIFVLDESDLLLASDVSNFPDLSPLDRLHRLGREMGIMSCVCVSGF